jgi:cytochrome oxidase Cu insertion factor (SCO1/SenC/PrrC family)
MADTAVNTPRASRRLLPLLLVLSGGGLLASIFLPLPWSRPKAQQLGDPNGLYDAPAFTLTERSGRTVSSDELKGKVWVASFVFTHCSGPCPVVSATMARLQTELDLANEPDLRLVTFTMDPERDTPEQLQKYSESYRASADRWLFLTGPEAEMHKLIRDGFKIGVSRSTIANPPVGQEFMHKTNLVVVDRNGRIRGYFEGYQGPHDTEGKLFADSYGRLKATVAGLLNE